MWTFNETEVTLASNSLVMQVSGVYLVHICYNGLIDITAYPGSLRLSVMAVPVSIVLSGSCHFPSKTEKIKRRGAESHYIAPCKANLPAKTEQSTTPFSPFTLVLKDLTCPAQLPCLSLSPWLKGM